MCEMLLRSITWPRPSIISASGFALEGLRFCWISQLGVAERPLETAPWNGVVEISSANVEEMLCGCRECVWQLICAFSALTIHEAMKPVQQPRFLQVFFSNTMLRIPRKNTQDSNGLYTLTDSSPKIKEFLSHALWHALSPVALVVRPLLSSSANCCSWKQRSKNKKTHDFSSLL